MYLGSGCCLHGDKVTAFTYIYLHLYVLFTLCAVGLLWHFCPFSDLMISRITTLTGLNVNANSPVRSTKWQLMDFLNILTTNALFLGCFHPCNLSVKGKILTSVSWCEIYANIWWNPQDYKTPFCVDNPPKYSDFNTSWFSSSKTSSEKYWLCVAKKRTHSQVYLLYLSLKIHKFDMCYSMFLYRIM